MIASELADNSGASVTNAVEQLATEMERRHASDPGERLIFVEHYPARDDTAGHPAGREHFALATFARADDGSLHHPEWRHLASDELVALLGQLVDA